MRLSSKDTDRDNRYFITDATGNTKTKKDDLRLSERGSSVYGSWPFVAGSGEISKT
jgi:hypothetical protein